MFLYFVSYLQGDTHVTELASPPTHTTFRPYLDTLSLPLSPYFGILTTEEAPPPGQTPARAKCKAKEKQAHSLARGIRAWVAEPPPSKAPEGSSSR